MNLANTHLTDTSDLEAQLFELEDVISMMIRDLAKYSKERAELQKKLNKVRFGDVE